VRTTTFIVKILLVVISNVSKNSFTGTQNHIQSSRHQERKELKSVYLRWLLSSEVPESYASKDAYYVIT